MCRRKLYERNQLFVPDRTLWPDLIVVSTPFLHFPPGVVKAHKPVRVQTFRSELAVEGFNEAIVRRRSSSAEVQEDAPLIGLEVEITADELRALIHPDRPKESDLPANLVEGLHYILASTAEPCIHRR